MKDRVLNRYELTEDKNIMIDISVRTIEDLYDNFDRTATYPKLRRCESDCLGVIRRDLS